MRVSALLSLLPLAAATPIAQDSGLATLITRDAAAAAAGATYIVLFKDGSTSANVQEALKDVPGGASRIYDSLLHGFVAYMDSATVSKLRQNGYVDTIEQDRTGSSSGYVTQHGSTWGLHRISHRLKGQEGSYSYSYDQSAGSGVCVYVTDSGIDASHPEFEGRASQIKSFVQGSNIDDLGHGTHVAGTIGSKSYGVAKLATIYGIKVISSQDIFYYSDLIAAYDFIVKDSSTRYCPNGVVINGSLGGGYSAILNSAAAKMSDRQGYFMAVAAGNNNQDTKNHSPASAPSVCTVGGSDKYDQRYTQSNYGAPVDIIAPAVGVLSTLPNGRTQYYTGTSMASPHIAGMAAVIASSRGTKASPQICDDLVGIATTGAITNQYANTVNKIAFNNNPTG